MKKEKKKEDEKAAKEIDKQAEVRRTRAKKVISHIQRVRHDETDHAPRCAPDHLRCCAEDDSDADGEHVEGEGGTLWLEGVAHDEQRVSKRVQLVERNQALARVVAEAHRRRRPHCRCGWRCRPAEREAKGCERTRWYEARGRRA
eukprot:6190072-Pleurochrysis_carterae.AAC.1